MGTLRFCIRVPHRRVLVDPVDQRVGARELTDGFHVGVGDQPLEVVGRRRAREPFDLGISRGVALEPRMPGFDALTFQRVDVEVIGAAVVGDVEQAVGRHVERGAHPDLGPRRAGDLEPHRAVERLAEVDHEDARPGVGDRDRLEDLA